MSCGERLYIVTAAAASALRGKAKAQAVMLKLPSRKFKGHMHGARMRATDSDASIGDKRMQRKNWQGGDDSPKCVSLMLATCRR